MQQNLGINCLQSTENRLLLLFFKKLFLYQTMFFSIFKENRLGRVDEVAFDPCKSQSQEYVCLRILFDVSKPLRKLMEFNLPKGGKATMYFA